MNLELETNLHYTPTRIIVLPFAIGDLKSIDQATLSNRSNVRRSTTAAEKAPDSAGKKKAQTIASNAMR